MSTLNPPIRDWTDRRVWLIGASSGIGAALAAALLQQGARVILSARRPQALAQVAGNNERASVLPFDAAEPAGWPAAVAAAKAVWGGVDLVIFMAAHYAPQRAWEIDAAAAEQSFQLNVLAVYRGLALLLPEMLAQGQGGIALVASVSGYTGLPQATVYGASKAALINLAETLYFDLAPRGVAVYLVNPGFVETPMTASNGFAMPELISPAQAAQAMLAGFARGQFEIRFPPRFTRLLRWFSRLPYRWRFPLLHKVTGL